MVFPIAGHVFEQDVPARHQPDEARFDEFALAQNDGFDVIGELLQVRREFERRKRRFGSGGRHEKSSLEQTCPQSAGFLFEFSERTVVFQKMKRNWCR